MLGRYMLLSSLVFFICFGMVFFVISAGKIKLTETK